MADTIKIRRDIEANWNAVASTCILAEGEIGIITDKAPLQCKIGNGISNWLSLPVQAWVQPGSIDALSDSLESLSGSLEDNSAKLEANTSYIICSTASGSAAKVVNLPNFELSTHCKLAVRMTEKNVADNPTLNINNTGAIPIWFNGVLASEDNSWDDGATLDVFYDGTVYQSAVSGGDRFSSGQLVTKIGIDDTQLINPAPNALAKAEDVMSLAVKLEGVTASKTKVQLVANETFFDGKYVVPSTSTQYKGQIRSASSGNPTNGVLVVNNLDTLGIKKITFLGFNNQIGSGGGSAWGFHTANITNENISSVTVADVHDYEDSAESPIAVPIETNVPSYAKSFVCTIRKVNNAVMTQQSFYCYLFSGETVSDRINSLQEKDTEIEADVEAIVGTLVEKETDAIELGLMSSRKGSLDRSVFYTNTSSGATLWKINIEGIEKIHLETNDNYLILFVSKSDLPTTNTYDVSVMRENYMAICEGFNPASNTYRISVNSNSEIDLILNQNCKYLFLSKYYSSKDRIPKELKLIKYVREGGIVSDLEKNIETVGSPLKLQIKDGLCFTRPIPLVRGFFLSVKEEYRILNSYLVNHLTGQIVNDDYKTNTVSGVQSEIYRSRSEMRKIPGYDIIYQIIRADGNPIEDGEGIISEFAVVEDTCKRMLPNGISSDIYKAFLDKVQTSMGVVWIPSLEAANRIPTSHSNSSEKRYRRGTTYLGVNYSGPTEWGKHVGMEVSMRTFVTAIRNPRSVMYTEIIGTSYPKAAKSAYGFNHASYGVEAGAYYGCVCTGLTSYLLGLNQVFQSSQWNSGQVKDKMDAIIRAKVISSSPDTVVDDDVLLIGEGDTAPEISYSNYQQLAGMVQPMDFLYKDGHCAVISGVYTNEWGEIKYIVIAEQTTPVSEIKAYTPEFFCLRLKNYAINNKNWKLLRRKSTYPWSLNDAEIPRIGQDKEFVIMNNSQYNPPDMGNIDPDITCFAGEYAAFVIGDYTSSENNYKMYLNIHRGGSDGYTDLQIFNEDDGELTTPIAEIDITNYETNTALGTDGYILPSDQEEDWIIYNLADYWNNNLSTTTGRFKARIVRKENGNVVDDYVSGFTHFLMVNMSVTWVDGVVSYTSKGAIPLLFRRESSNGLYRGELHGSRRYENLNEDSYSYDDTTGNYSGNANISWDDNSEGDRLRFVAKTDYGLVNVRTTQTISTEE